MKKLILTISFLFIANCLHAAPIVTNATDNGDGTISISGSGFSTHNDYSEASYTGGLNATYRDFEEGELPYQDWDIAESYPPIDNWELTTSGNIEGSVYAARGLYFGQTGALQYNMSHTGIYLYTCFYMRTIPSNAGGKFLRVWGEPYDQHYVYFASGGIDGGTIRGSVRADGAPALDPNASIEYNGSGTNIEDNVNRFIEVIINDSDYPDDNVQVFVNGELEWEHDDWLAHYLSDDGNTVVDVPFDFDGHTYDLRNTLLEGGEFTYDNVFVDYTLSRVIVTDNEIYASSTKFQPVIPSTWSDSAITGVFDDSQFSEEDTLYAHVFIDGEEAVYLLGSAPVNVTSSISGTARLSGRAFLGATSSGAII